MGRPVMPRAVERVFWRGLRSGVGLEEASFVAGVSVRRGRKWLAEGGGVPMIELGDPSDRYLSMNEREEIAVGLAAKLSQAEIARRLGRDPATISRTVSPAAKRNCHAFTSSIIGMKPGCEAMRVSHALMSGKRSMKPARFSQWMVQR